MTPLFKTLIATAAIAFAGHAAAEATLYESHDYRGRAFTTREAVNDLGRVGFADQASSMVITNTPWAVCDGAGFSGRCIIMQPGNYPSLREIGLNNRIASLRPIRDTQPPPPPPPPHVQMDGSITFYENDGFNGRSFTLKDTLGDFRRGGFNDDASSIVVRGDRWVVCEHTNYEGKCAILRPGLYPSLGSIGFNDRISSARELPNGQPIDPNRFMPPPVPWFDWHARPSERLYDVQISWVRAVYGTPQQHCWVEREQVVQHGDPAGGAIIGGLVGGILGHELAGRGDKTVGGAAGAIIGATIGANASQGYVSSSQNVQRCGPVAGSARPAYWDVMYVFRGAEHHVQMTAPPPNNMLRVNEAGEPRI
jgi:uncharacterized protein YcfJ